MKIPKIEKEIAVAIKTSANMKPIESESSCFVTYATRAWRISTHFQMMTRGAVLISTGNRTE